MQKVKWLAVIAVLLVFACAAIAQQQKLDDFKYQFKVGVLPFIDATGTGNDETGSAVGRAVQAEFAHSTNLLGRVLKLEEEMTADDIDPQQAVELGRKRKVDAVIVGTILEAKQDSSDKSMNTPSVFGQSLGGRASRATATVTIQGDLFNVVNGKKIGSFRVTGKSSDTKVGADVNTTLGDLSSGGGSPNSPLAKALNNAVAELVRKVAAEEPNMLRYTPVKQAEPEPADVEGGEEQS